MKRRILVPTRQTAQRASEIPLPTALVFYDPSVVVYKGRVASAFFPKIDDALDAYAVTLDDLEEASEIPG